MNAVLSFFVIGLAGGFGLGPLTARADLEVSAAVSIHAPDDFYAPLAPSGTWIEVQPYGRCWCPAGVAVEWRPYCYGHWVWTDCGWYWVSDEPWGWACYHYGCWVCDPIHAWIWVPGIEWAPAWVTWRVGAGHIGWAPLPPRGVTVAGPSFVFVETAHFRESVRPSHVIVNNATILNQTTVINNIKRETRHVGQSGPQKVVINEGPGLAAVQKTSAGPIKALPIGEVAREAQPPAGLSHDPGKFKNSDKPVLVPAEQPKLAPGHQALPGEHAEPPPKSPPPGFNRQPPIEGPRPSEHPPPTRPPRTAPKSPDAKGADQDPEQESGHHGSD